MTVAERAAAWALTQIGRPYVFGAAGPSAFDCSGLVVAAWEHVGGAILPHWTVALHRVTERVQSVGELAPGDLVFYYGTPDAGYADPSHVAIFLRREKGRSGRTRHMIVQATDPAHGVESVRMRLYAQPTSYGRVTSR